MIDNIRGRAQESAKTPKVTKTKRKIIWRRKNAFQRQRERPKTVSQISISSKKQKHREGAMVVRKTHLCSRNFTEKMLQRERGPNAVTKWEGGVWRLCRTEAVLCIYTLSLFPLSVSLCALLCLPCHIQNCYFQFDGDKCLTDALPRASKTYFI